MASFIDTREQDATVEREILSMQHVRLVTDGRVSVEMPFFYDQFAGSIHVLLSPSEALELASRIINTVNRK